MYAHSTQSADLDAVLRNGHHRERHHLFRSCQSAAAAAANISTFVPNIRFCARHRRKVGHPNTSARGRWRRKRATKRSRRFSVTRPFLCFLSVARAVHAPALRDEWNTPAVFRHEATVNVRVFLHEFIYLVYNTLECTFLYKNEKRAPYKNNAKYLLAGR